MSNEITHASTTQLFNPHTMDWDEKTISELGFDKNIFGQLINSGTVVGPLEPILQKELKIEHTINVVAVGTHDTASAVAAVPNSKGKDFLYISSGTWSLLGVEIDSPITTDQALVSGFTNEIGINNSIRFLKNIMGMWIQQECVRYWESLGETIDWKELDQLTIKELDYKGCIDPLDNIYLKPNSPDSLMIDRVKQKCKEAHFDEPSNHGQVMVAIYRGLAKAYAKSIKEIEGITKVNFDAIHVIGGGCKNEILNQMTSNETGITVYAGPVEATALGNLLVQGIATGDIKDVQQGRSIIIESQKVKVFTPQ
jgi:rhamnulokinase